MHSAYHMQIEENNCLNHPAPVGETALGGCPRPNWFGAGN